MQKNTSTYFFKMQKHFIFFHLNAKCVCKKKKKRTDD